MSDVDGLPTSKRQKMDGDGENEEQGLKRQVSQSIRTSVQQDFINLTD